MNTCTVSRAQIVAQAIENAYSDNSIVVLTGNTLDVFFNFDTGSAVRLDWIIAGKAAEHDMPTMLYSLAGGVRPFIAQKGLTMGNLPTIAPEDDPTISIDDVFEAMDQEGRPCMLVVMYAEGILPCSGSNSPSYSDSRIVEQFVSRANDIDFQEAGHRIVLVACADSLNNNLLSLPGITVVDVGLPDCGERLGAINRWLTHPSHPLFLEDGLDLLRLAEATGGMDLDSISRMRHTSSVNSPLCMDAVKAAKREVIRRLAGDSLEVLDEERTFDEIAGQYNVKTYVSDMRNIGASGLRIILAGPPGTGKTTSAIAIANALDAVAVQLQPTVLDKYVGESEKKMANVFNVIESLGRVLLFIDEADQGLLSKRANSASEESSSVYPSLRGMIMSKTGDTGTASDLTILVATNNPRGLDGAILSRMVVLPVLEAASPAERTHIMEIQVKKNGLMLEDGAALEAFTRFGEPIDGRSINNILNAAHIVASREGSKIIRNSDIEYALAHTHCIFGPTEQLASMKSVACTAFDDHLPWRAAWKAGITDYQAPAYLRAFIDEKTGAVDRVKLENHIANLEKDGH